VLKTIDDLAVAGRHVLVRADLNVPLDGGRIWASGRASLFTYGHALGALRRLGQRAGRAPLNAADRGYAVDRVHDRPRINRITRNNRVNAVPRAPAALLQITHDKRPWKFRAVRSIRGPGVRRNFRAAWIFRAISRRGTSVRTWITRLPQVTPRSLRHDRRP
jgi:hypothetical protein